MTIVNRSDWLVPMVKAFLDSAHAAGSIERERETMRPGGILRCAWVGSEPLFRTYHDREWGVPVHDDRLLFEFLILEGAQAGLSWITILRKRACLPRRLRRLRPRSGGPFRWSEGGGTSGQPRHRPQPPEGGIRHNAMPAPSWRYRRSSAPSTPTSGVLWTAGRSGTPGESIKEVPASTPVSDAMSRDLKRRGFRFVGSTICYAHMQAVGMVNDHTVDCFRWRAVGGKSGAHRRNEHIPEP